MDLVNNLFYAPEHGSSVEPMTEWDLPSASALKVLRRSDGNVYLIGKGLSADAATMASFSDRRVSAREYLALRVANGRALNDGYFQVRDGDFKLSEVRPWRRYSPADSADFVNQSVNLRDRANSLDSEINLYGAHVDSSGIQRSLVTGKRWTAGAIAKGEVAPTPSPTPAPAPAPLPPPTTSIIRINFQNPGASPANYVADVGLSFGDRTNGLRFGWSADNQASARRRTHPDARLSTLNHLRALSWGIEVPNGTYRVRLTAGDAGYFDSIFGFSIESSVTALWSASDQARFKDFDVIAVVRDGRLSIGNREGSFHNKIVSVELERISDEIVKIQFQPAGAPTLEGFDADVGAPLGVRVNGLTYGWDLDNSAHARSRAGAADSRFQSFTHLQKQDGNRIFEVAIANGTYRVEIGAGDVDFFDSAFGFRVEGISTTTVRPTSERRTAVFTQLVEVKDGRLTIANHPMAENNKVSYLIVSAASD